MRVLGSMRALRAVAIAAVAVVAVLLVPGGAMAVHNAGCPLSGSPPMASNAGCLFELDGNVQNDTGSGGNNGGFDWASGPGGAGVFDSTGNPTLVNPQLLKSDFVADYPQPDASYFATSTKDIDDVNTWQCGSVNSPTPKDEILNAYAALWSPTSGADAGHVILTAASERFTNNGDSFMGFWLFQGRVACNSPTGAATPFVGAHNVGDVLVLSNFTGGGANPLVQVYAWNPGTPQATNPLELKFSGNFCTGASNDPTVDQACGAVNDDVVPDAVGTVEHGPHRAAAERVPRGGGRPVTTPREHGSLLRALPGGDADVAADDGAVEGLRLGQLQLVHGDDGDASQGCERDDAQRLDARAVLDGDPRRGHGHGHCTGRDRAESGGHGRVQLLPDDRSDGGRVDRVLRSSTPAGTRTLTGASNPATVSSDNVTGLSAGRYCFTATYLDTGTPPDYPLPASDNSTTECFLIADANIRITPATANNPVGTNHVLTITVNAIGGTIGAGPHTATASIVSGPGSFVGSPSCTYTGGAATASCQVTITSGAAGTTVVSATAAIPVSGVTITRTTGTAANTGVGGSGNASKLWADATARTDILNASGAVVTTVVSGTVVHDKVFVDRLAGTPAAVPNPTGNVIFHRYATIDCTGAATDQTVALTAGSPSTALSADFAPTGNMSYKADYQGDANYPARSGACEPLTVTPALAPASRS